MMNISALVKNNYSHSLYCIYNATSQFFIKNYGISGPLISYWLMVDWSVFGALGRLLVDRWSVVGGRLVGW